MDHGWQCAVCGAIHEGLPTSFAAEFPDMYASLKREERDSRCVIGSDQCEIDHEWFFIRGCLELPIIGSKEPFLWGLWACVNGEIYDEISESWQLEGREKTRGPYRGRLSNSLSVYPETLNLKIRIEIQPVGIRPLFLLQEHEHQLAIEQHSGITPGRAVELACLLLHQQRGGIDFEQKITRQSHST